MVAAVVVAVVAAVRLGLARAAGCSPLALPVLLVLLAPLWLLMLLVLMVALALPVLLVLLAPLVLLMLLVLMVALVLPVLLAVATPCRRTRPRSQEQNQTSARTPPPSQRS